MTKGSKQIGLWSTKGSKQIGAIQKGVTESRNEELDPKCLNGDQEAFAITNRGELIPCCWLDTYVQKMEHNYIMLTLASNLNDYDSIEEILLQDEWVDFRTNLKNGKGFDMCHLMCKKREIPQHKKITIYSDKGVDPWTKAT
jgi:hypothetical protein